MKVRELVEAYNKNRTINLKSVLEVQEYISIAYKRDIAELVLSECITNKNGYIQVNSLDRYLLFTMTVIGAHTNLEIIDEDGIDSALDAFDILSSSGLLEKIIDCFRADYDACQIVLDMLTSDIIKNQETLERKICKMLDDIKEQFYNLEKLENKEQILNLLSEVINQ